MNPRTQNNGGKEKKLSNREQKRLSASVGADEGLSDVDKAALPLIQAVDALVEAKPKRSAEHIFKISKWLQSNYVGDESPCNYDTTIWHVARFFDKAPSSAEKISGLHCLGALLLNYGEYKVSSDTYTMIESSLQAHALTSKVPLLRGECAHIYGLLAMLGCRDECHRDSANKWFIEQSTSTFRLGPMRKHKHVNQQSGKTTVKNRDNSFDSQTTKLEESVKLCDSDDASRGTASTCFGTSMSQVSSSASIMEESSKHRDSKSPKQRLAEKAFSKHVSPDTAVSADGFITGWTMLALTWRKSELANTKSGPGAQLFEYILNGLDSACQGPQDAAQSAGTTAGLIVYAMWQMGVVKSANELETNLDLQRLLGSMRYLCSGLTTFAQSHDNKDKQKATQSLRASLEVAETGSGDSVRKSADSDSRTVASFDPPSVFLYENFKKYLKASMREHLVNNDSICKILVEAGASINEETYALEDKKSFKASHLATVRESKKNRFKSRNKNRDQKAAYCNWSDDT
eukprot:Selendium_serpulae@DN5094_c0_g1_i1.p1